MGNSMISEEQFNKVIEKLDNISEYIHNIDKKNIERDIAIGSLKFEMAEMKTWQNMMETERQQKIGAIGQKENLKNSIISTNKVMVAVVSMLSIGAFLTGWLMESPKLPKVKYHASRIDK